jgi:GH25 family lysozyme M1 (1,4-beta-N-acetylmuramidase)
MILGIDVSKWQDNNATPQQIDFAKAKAAGAKFVFIKCGQGNWKDSDFDYNWRASREAGIPRGAYWYLDNGYSPEGQAELMARFIPGDDPGELPRIADFEHRLNVPLNAAARLLIFLQAIKRTDANRQPIIYTAPAYWREHGSPDVMWRMYPLWIAHYGVTVPSVPAPWVKWSFWQYTSNGPGPAFGMESLSLDMDYYQPGQGFDHILIPAPPPISEAEKLARLWNAHPELH